MPEWARVRLSDVMKLRKEFITIDDTKTYMRCRAQWRAQGVILRDVVLGEFIKTKRQQVCRAGEFLVAEIDAKEGGFGMVPEQLDGSVVSSHYFLFELDHSYIDADFLGYYIRTPDFMNQVQAQGSTNYSAVRPSHVLNYVMPLPPLPEQRRIVARVKGMLDKVEEARGLGVEVDEVSEQFVVALHCLLSGNRVLRVGDFLELDERKVPVSTHAEYPQVGVRSFGKGLFERETLNATQTTYKQFHQLYPGAVVLSQVKGWEGAIGVCPEHLADRFASPEFRTFRCIGGEASAEYLDMLVRTEWFWSKLKDATRGVGARRERTRPEQFLNMLLPMPSLQDQEQAVKMLSKLHRATEYRKTHAPELDALPASILARAFAGAL